LDKDQKEMWKLAGRYMGIGVEMGVSVAVGLLLGRYLDQKFHTSPWLTVFLGAAGIGAAGKAVYDAVKKTDLDKL
jgi:ATP synthase protein I